MIKFPGHYGFELFRLDGDIDAQRALMATIPESMKAPARSCYRREKARAARSSASKWVRP